MSFLRSIPFLLMIAACGGHANEPRSATAAHPTEPVRLYALDCGRIEITDFGFFTDSGKPIGKGRTLADPCFLIRHPRGTLLWDTGLKTSIAESKEGVPNPVGQEFVDASLRDQLATLSLRPEDITFVSISHAHQDHSGNLNMFTASTWLLNRAELESALKSPAASSFSEVNKVKTKLLDRDEDVFGDGLVRILQTPGHTPGHQSLLVRLEKSGAVVLSGDLAHSRENWEKHIVPSFNDSHDNTIASMKHVEDVLKENHARFIVQHAVEDFRALPKFPRYLD
jgi:N-acyl homoserine lactone hydrolase